ncbi:MAG: adenylosuccinate lyase [Bacilli bacterium]|nr:adenylosuccinate lyase [Bacilli bacterium]
MIERYQRPIMKKLWSDEYKFQCFLRVEQAASYAWMKKGLFDEITYERLLKATFTLEDIYRNEQDTKHDVIAFIQACTASLGEEKKWFHYALTSTDVVDTANSLILKEVNEIILSDIERFMDVLKRHALKYKYTPCMGRTHGMHAEVTSFGLKFTLWYEDFKRLRKHFLDARETIEVVKMSGAVGNFYLSHPDIQTIVADKLGLKEPNITTQTLQRDRHAYYLSVLALIASEIEKIAVEIRHLSRQEVGEVSEAFTTNQKGSSAMPHKRNPISSENVSGLARVVRGYLISTFENIPLWHERDISHSSVERIVLADATTLIDYILNRYTNTLETLVVNENRMLENINLTQGVIFASTLLSQLIKKGFMREEAYKHIQKLSLQALDTKTPLINLIRQDEILSHILTDSELNEVFSLEKHLVHVDTIYQKVFNKN